MAAWTPPENTKLWEPPEDTKIWSPPEETKPDSEANIDDPWKLRQLKESGRKLTDRQERILWEANEEKPLIDKGVEFLANIGGGIAKAVPEIVSGTGKLLYTGVYKPLDALPAIITPEPTGVRKEQEDARGGKVANTNYTRQEAKKIADDAVRSWRSFVIGVAKDAEEMINAGVRGLTYGTGTTDALIGMPKEKRWERFQLREQMREFEQAEMEENPDRAAALLADNPLLRGLVKWKAAQMGLSPEEQQKAAEDYSRLLLESGLTKEEIDEDISAAGEFFSPISIPGANKLTSAISKKAAPAIQKGTEKVLQNVVRPVVYGIERTSKAVDVGGEFVQSASKKLGEYTVDNPDTFVATAANTAAIPVRGPAKATNKIARATLDVLNQVDEGGLAGRRGIFERAGRADGSSALTKKLWGSEGWGGIGRAKTADWMLRQSAAIAQPAVSGGALNVALGLPDIETPEQGGFMFGYGMGIGGLSGARIPERAQALIDPTTTASEKLSTVLTPDPAQRRKDEDADLKRFLNSATPELQAQMQEFASIESRKKALDQRIAELEQAKSKTIGKADDEIYSRLIENTKKQRAKLDTATPQTEAEILRQVQLAFLDGLDQAQATTAAAGLDNFRLVILKPENAEAFYRKLYGNTLVNAERTKDTYIGQTLSGAEAQAMMQADQVINRFRADVQNAQNSRGFAIQEDSADAKSPNFRPEHLRRLNQRGATVVINADLIKHLSNNSFNFRDVVMHEIQHGLNGFREIQEMQRPLREFLFDQKVVDREGNPIKDENGDEIIGSYGFFSDQDIYNRAPFYAQKFSPNDGGAGFFVQFGGNRQKLINYLKEEIVSELAALSGDYANGTRATLDDAGRSIMDWAEIKTRNGVLKKVKEGMRRAGVVFDNFGAYSEVLNQKFTPETMAMFRQYQRGVRDLNSSLVYNRGQEKSEKDIPWTTLMNSRALQERNKDTGVFETEVIIKAVTPDGNLTEIKLPEGAQLNPFIDVYVSKDGILIDGDGNPLQNIPQDLVSSLPDGTQFSLDTRIVRDPTGKPVVVSPSEMTRRAVNRTAMIRNAIDTAKQDDSGLRMTDRGNGNYRGAMSPSQVQAVMDLPNSIVAPRLKRLIKFTNDMLAKNDGTRMFIEYQASLLRGRYKALSPRFRDEIPIGFQVSKDGNFLITTISVSRLYDKAEAWAAKRPQNLQAWGGDLGKFWDTVIKVLQNHATGKKGEEGLHPDSETAIEMKNGVNDLFNIYNAETKALNPRRTTMPRQRGKDSIDGVVRARRLDRITSYEEAEMQKMPVNYGKMLENYLPANPILGVSQSPEEFMQNTGGAVTAAEIRNAIRDGKTEELEKRLRYFDDIRPFETLFIEPAENGDVSLRVANILDSEIEPSFEDTEVVTDFVAEAEQKLAQVEQDFNDRILNESAPVQQQAEIGEGMVNINYLPDQSPISTQSLLNLVEQRILDERKEKLPPYKIEIEEYDKGGFVRTPNEVVIRMEDEAGNPIGLASLDTDFRDLPNTIKVDWVRVHGWAQGKGYGEALYREIAKFAQANGFNYLFGEQTSPKATATRQKLFNTELQPVRGSYKNRPNAISEIDPNISYMPAWSPEQFAQRPEITTEPATDYEAQPLLPANKKLYRLEFGNKKTRKMTSQKGRTFFATTPESAATLALSHAFEGIQPTPENFSLYEYEIPETADIQRDYTLINNFDDAFGSARINAVRQAHNAMGIPLDVYRHVDAQNIKGITGTKIPWEANLLDYYRLIREENPANPPMTLNEFRKNVFENPNSEEEFGYSYEGDNLEEAYDEYLADQAMANSYAVEEAKQRLKFDPNTSYLPASGEYDPNSDSFFNEAKKKAIAKDKANPLQPAEYNEDLFDNWLNTGKPIWQLTFDEFAKSWIKNHKQKLKESGVQTKWLTLENLLSSSWLRNSYSDIIRRAMDSNFDVPQNVVDQYKNSGANPNISYLPAFQPNQSEEYGLEAGQQAEMRLTPKTLFNLYWMMTEPEPNNEYGKSIRKEYIDRYTNLYKNVFKDLVRKQIEKYINRGRVDPEVTKAALSSANSAEDLEKLMRGTYRSDMKRRNDVWNIASEHLTNLEKAQTPKDKLFYMDRLNNSIHNTQELLFSKFANAGSLMTAFDRIAAAKSTAAYRNFVDKDLREADSFGGTAYLPAVNYTIPKDPRMLMADFYLLTTADIANIFANPLEKKGGVGALYDPAERIKGLRSEEYLANLNEAIDTLSDQAQQHMKDALLFSVSAELRHLYVNSQPDRVKPLLEHPFMQKYKEIYDTYNFLSGTKTPKYMDTYVESIQPESRAARITKGSNDNYRRSYAAVRKAMEETGVSLAEVATIAEKLFREGRWNSSYGGNPWGNISEGLRNVAQAKTRAEKIKAIDDAYALQHNTGKALNKLQRYMRAGSYAWLDQMLDFKYHALSPREFMPLTSLAAMKIAAPALIDVGFPAKDGMRRDLIEKTNPIFVEEIENAVNKLAPHQEDIYSNIGVTAKKGTGRDINAELVKWLTKQLTSHYGAGIIYLDNNLKESVPYVRILLAEKMAWRPQLPPDIQAAFEKLKKEEAQAKAEAEAKAKAAMTVPTSWETIAKLPPSAAQTKVKNWKQYWVNWLGYNVFRKAPAEAREKFANMLLDIIFLIDENGNIQITNQLPDMIINEFEYPNNLSIKDYVPNSKRPIGYEKIAGYINTIKSEAEMLALKIAETPTQTSAEKLKWEDFKPAPTSNYETYPNGDLVSGAAVPVWVDGVPKVAYIVVHHGGTTITLGANQKYTVQWGSMEESLEQAKKGLADQISGKYKDIVDDLKEYEDVNLSFVDPAIKKSAAKTSSTKSPQMPATNAVKWHEVMMQKWKASKSVPNKNVLFSEATADKILDAIVDPITGAINTNKNEIFKKAEVNSPPPQATNTWAWIEQAIQTAWVAKSTAEQAAQNAPTAKSAEEKWKNEWMAKGLTPLTDTQKSKILDAMIGAVKANSDQYLFKKLENEQLFGNEKGLDLNDLYINDTNSYQWVSQAWFSAKALTGDRVAESKIEPKAESKTSKPSKSTEFPKELEWLSPDEKTYILQTIDDALLSDLTANEWLGQFKLYGKTADDLYSPAAKQFLTQLYLQKQAELPKQAPILKLPLQFVQGWKEGVKQELKDNYWDFKLKGYFGGKYSMDDLIPLLDAIVDPNTGEIANTPEEAIKKSLVVLLSGPQVKEFADFAIAKAVNSAKIAETFYSSPASQKEAPAKLNFLSSALLQDLKERLDMVYRLKSQTQTPFYTQDINKVVSVWETINWQTKPKKLSAVEMDEIYAYAYDYVSKLANPSNPKSKTEAPASFKPIPQKLQFLAEHTDVPASIYNNLIAKLDNYLSIKLDSKAPATLAEVENQVAEWELNNKQDFTKNLNLEQINSIKQHAFDYVYERLQKSTDLADISAPSAESATPESTLKDLPPYTEVPQLYAYTDMGTPLVENAIKKAVMEYGGEMQKQDIIDFLNSDKKYSSIVDYLDNLPNNAVPALVSFAKDYAGWAYTASPAEFDAEKRTVDKILDSELSVEDAPKTQWKDVDTTSVTAIETPNGTQYTNQGQPLPVMSFSNGQFPISTPFEIYDTFGAEPEKFKGTAVAGGFLNPDGETKTNGVLFYAKDPKDGEPFWWAYPLSIMDEDLAGEMEQLTLDQNQSWEEKFNELLMNPQSDLYDAISGLGEYAFSPIAKLQITEPAPPTKESSGPKKEKNLIGDYKTQLFEFGQAISYYANDYWDKGEGGWLGIAKKMFDKNLFANDQTISVANHILVPMTSSSEEVFILHGKENENKTGYTMDGAVEFGPIGSKPKKELMQDIADWLKHYIEYYENQI